jgi:hypothetical protein
MVIATIAVFVFISAFKTSAVGNPVGAAKTTTTQPAKIARIVLALDASGSMCQEVTSCMGASNNDPTNKRVDGANAFVDSVAKRCPACEVGVVIYTGVSTDSTGRNTITNLVKPLPLVDANVTALHAAIARAACASRNLGKPDNLGKVAKRALTFTGIALDSAIRMVDAGYDTIVDRMERHIILLTDGDWQKPTTAQIISAYTANFPDRKLPVVHGVFLSDSATHVSYGFPPQGLTTCTPPNRHDSTAIDTVKAPMDISDLRLATSETGGMFFPGSTPQTIVATFDSIMHLYSSPPVTRAGYKPFLSKGRRSSFSKIALFDPSGRLLKNCPQSISQGDAFDFRGIYFVKYQNGSIERRMNLPKYGVSGR